MNLEKTNINIGKQERKGMTFTQVKSLNGLQFQHPFSYDQYEKMTKVACVAIWKANEDRLIFIT